MTMYAVMSTITSTIWKFVDLPVKPKSEALENRTLFSIQIKKIIHYTLRAMIWNFAKDCENFDFSTILIGKRTFPKYFVIERNLIYRNNLLRFFSFSWLFWQKPLLQMFGRALNTFLKTIKAWESFLFSWHHTNNFKTVWHTVKPSELKVQTNNYLLY